MREEFKNSALTITVEISCIKPFSKAGDTQNDHLHIPLYELLNQI